MMVAALALQSLGAERRMYLYDTYEGMSEPTDHDRSFAGCSASSQLAQQPRGTGVWCHASLEDVRANLESTGYCMSRLQFVQGKVEDTVPAVLPDRIALLRLDTDWYESTRHELFHFYPQLLKYGVMIVDDYGHWQGSRQAVDEYFVGHECPIMLHRIDYTGRVMVKMED